MSIKDQVRDVLLGVAVGDALGVPVEFSDRRELVQQPVTGMREYGTHQQPAGTWSDDSSLTFCLAEMLCGKYDLQNLANRFVNWQDYGYWSPHGSVFDIGIATSAALHLLRRGVPPKAAGGRDEYSNGNGSLMRIAPLLFYIRDMPVEQRFRHIKEVSSLTHAHIRSVLSCFIWLEFALAIMQGCDKITAFGVMQERVNGFLFENAICTEAEWDKFHRVLGRHSTYEPALITGLNEDEVQSSGYVLSTLEASFWCILTTGSFEEAVLKAVNLGSDTDTTAAVTGGVAGLIYGHRHIPAEWLNVLARREDIEDLGDRLAKNLR